MCTTESASPRDPCTDHQGGGGGGGGGKGWRQRESQGKWRQPHCRSYHGSLSSFKMGESCQLSFLSFFTGSVSDICFHGATTVSDQ